MLGKLIRYEFKATKKFMLLAYALLFVMSVILGIGSRIDFDIFMGNSVLAEIGGLIGGILMLGFVLAYVAVNCAVFAGMFFFAINRFRHNILGNEGYLMHTLPVRPCDHVIAKTAVSTVWTFCSFIVATLSYMTLFFIAYGNEISSAFSEISSEAILSGTDFSGGYRYMAESVIVVVVSVVAGYLQIYASMAMGYSNNANRALLSIAVYIGINISWSIVEAILTLPLSGVSQARLFSGDGVHMMLLVSFLSALLKSVACYYIATFFLAKKLNLQ